MTLYDVNFVPNREKNPDAVGRTDPAWRGLTREAATELAFQLNTHMDDPESGVFKMTGAATWARPGLSWWGGQNEERFSEGPYPTKESALLASLSNDWRRVCLAEAKMGELRIPKMGEFIIEHIEDSNEDLGDPDGDGLFTKIGTAQYDALDAALINTVQTWMAEHKVESQVWGFSECHTTCLEIDLLTYLADAIPFSFNTFGPGARTNGVIDHITKELVEVQADDKEWVDVAILALDGAWRSQMKDDRPDDPPDATWFAGWLNTKAEYWLTQDTSNFGWIWDQLRQSPRDVGLWVALHISAMRQSVHLHESFSEDKAPSYGELFAKLTINKLRVWPDWRTADQGRAIEHDRTGE